MRLNIISGKNPRGNVNVGTNTKYKLEGLNQIDDKFDDSWEHGLEIWIQFGTGSCCFIMFLELNN